MFNRNKKRDKPTIESVNVYFKHGGEGSPDFMDTIQVPKGWVFITDYAEDPTLVDENENVRRSFDWRAGYTVEYEYIYSDTLS